MGNVDNPQHTDALDELVVVRCQLGERDAFDALITRWHPALSRYAMRLTGNAAIAGDVVQDVWLRVVRGLPRLRDAGKFRAWLFGIARRVLMDRLRLRYSTPAFEDVDLMEIADDSADDGRAEDLVLLQAELDRLPMIERHVLVLFYLNELSLSEIAEIAAIPVGTVKSRLFRARHMLRTQLVGKGSQP